MILLKIILGYTVAWLFSLLCCAVMAKIKSAMPTCKCGEDYRIENRELAVAMLVLLPLALPFIIYLVVKILHHKRGCLVKLVGDV